MNKKVKVVLSTSNQNLFPHNQTLGTKLGLFNQTARTNPPKSPRFREEIWSFLADRCSVEPLSEVSNPNFHKHTHKHTQTRSLKVIILMHFSNSQNCSHFLMATGSVSQHLHNKNFVSQFQVSHEEVSLIFGYYALLLCDS